MGLLVGSQITRLGEAFLAAWIAAHIWLLTCMGAKVRAQVKVEAEAFVADFTFVWLFTCMGAKVCAQVEVKAEAFVADFTFVWFLASVDELMSLELGVVQEFLVAT